MIGGWELSGDHHGATPAQPLGITMSASTCGSALAAAEPDRRPQHAGSVRDKLNNYFNVNSFSS